MTCEKCEHDCMVLYGQGTRWWMCPYCKWYVEFPYEILSKETVE